MIKEQFMIQEIRAYLSYSKIRKNIYFWRSKENEVDLITENELALEFKLSTTFKPEHAKGHLALKEEGFIKITISKFLL